MTPDHDERRHPSTWWVGRGRTTPRWWTAASGLACFALLATASHLIDFSRRDISSLLMWWGMVVVVLLAGWHEEHGSSGTWRALASASAVTYGVAALTALVALEPRGADIVALAGPLLIAAIAWVEARFKRRRRT